MKNKILTVSLMSFLIILSCSDKKSKDIGSNTIKKVNDSISSKLLYENAITKNVGKYPHEINLFDNVEVSKRLKKIVGSKYKEIIENFNTETPIVSENTIYKVTGCKQHECPLFHTTILFDAEKDNFNVVVDNNGKSEEFIEKEKINLSQSLKDK